MILKRHITVVCLIHIFLVSSQAAVTAPVKPDDPYYKHNSTPFQNLTVVSGLSADQLWKKFFTDTLPKGVKITKIGYSGTPKASGSYAGMPYINSVKPKDGILITTGTPENALGPNDEKDATVQNGTPGYKPLEQIGGPDWDSYDAAYFTLEFTTDTSIKGITFDFVYGSDEYPEFVGSEYNDVFAVFLDCKNISFDGNGKPITVNNNFFKVDNWAPPKLNLEYDGFTPLLRTSDSIKAGSHTLIFAIADVSDEFWDSGVFLSNFLFKFTQGGTNPVKNILDDQTFSVLEHSPAGTLVGKVKVLVADSLNPKINPIQPLPEFTFNTATREITVAQGAVLDFTIQNKYLLPMEGKVTVNNLEVRDSAMMTIMVLEAIPTVPHIDSAVVYDRNGNGIGDSLFIVFKSNFKNYVPEKAVLQWPPATTVPYDLKLGANNVSGTRALCIAYVPNTSEQIITKGEGSAKVTIDSTGIKFVRDGKVLDGIGPLLTHASIIERFAPANDTFFVDCTEEVNASDISGEAFILIKNFNTPAQKEIVLSLIGKTVDQGGEKSLLFAVGDIGAEAPKAGDYLKINGKGAVRDKRKNPAHPNNTPVPISLQRRPNRVVEASYRDMNGNGMVETIRMEFTKKVTDPNEIMCTVTWTDNKSAVLKDLKYDPQNERVLIADIEGIFSKGYLQDRTGGAMKLSVTYKTMNNQVIDYPVLDKAGPVVKEGVYVYGTGIGERSAFSAPVTDSLIVQFSESVAGIGAQKPFVFKNNAGTYILELAQRAGDSTIAAFKVTGPVNAITPVEGDSMWIESTSGVSDNFKNSQQVKDNKHAPVRIRLKPIQFKVFVIGPRDPAVDSIPEKLKPVNVPFTNEIKYGIPIVLDPMYSVPDYIMNVITVRAVIYDCVGNVLGEGKNKDDFKNPTVQIFKNKKMGRNKFVILWSGRNRYGRLADGGSYVAIIHVQNKNSATDLYKAMIPVVEK